MFIGIPREIKEGETRVSLTPQAVSSLTAQGHTVLVESEAGRGCGFGDDEYARAGAAIITEAAGIWSEAEMVVKVKEPMPQEYPYLREGLTLFAFLHLAAAPDLAQRLMRSGTTAIAFETVGDGSRLPLLAPMSEVAGCLSVQKGAVLLEAHHGGRGVLISGVSGAPPARVTVLGGGVAGASACRMAVGMGARVTIIDSSFDRLQYLRDVFSGTVSTLLSSPGAIEDCLAASDLTIGAALLPGRCAPRLITRSMLEGMPRGSVLVDISIDQGGVCETSRPTTHSDPCYAEMGVLHCCITNLPAAVPRTSTQALSSSILPYVIAIARKGVQGALVEIPHLRQGLNVIAGDVVHPGVRESLGQQPGGEAPSPCSGIG